MAIELPNGKISRTLPEQVGFNSEKIAEIIKAMYDLELVDKVIDLYSTSGVLTDNQFEIAKLSPSYILYSGKVFVKAYEDGTNIDFFEVGALAGGSTTLTLSVERFRITVSTKAYQYAVIQLFESYTKAQIDSLLNAKANLSGANFTGSITAPSIIENMSGYSFTQNEARVGITYAGVVKNGNKLTLALAISVNLAEAISSGFTIGTFTIPSAIGAKLFPFTLSGTDYLDIRNIEFASDGVTTINATARWLKYNNTTVVFNLRMENFAANTQYYGRAEITLLLSDNLAS